MSEKHYYQGKVSQIRSMNYKAFAAEFYFTIEKTRYKVIFIKRKDGNYRVAVCKKTGIYKDQIVLDWKMVYDCVSEGIGEWEASIALSQAKIS